MGCAVCPERPQGVEGLCLDGVLKLLTREAPEVLEGLTREAPEALEGLIAFLGGVGFLVSKRSA